MKFNSSLPIAIVLLLLFSNILQSQGSWEQCPLNKEFTKNNLKSTDIFQDNKNNVWFATNKGILVYIRLARL